MTLSIRPMQPGDAQAVATLSAELGYPAREADIAARFARIVTTPGNGLWVAEQQGTVVAWVHGVFTLLLESPAYVEVGGLVVSSAARRQGAGRQLINTLIAWAREQGVGEVRVRSNQVREEAHAFYRAQGFADLKTQCVFRLDLTKEAR